MQKNKIQYETRLTDLLMRKASNRKIPLSGTFELSPVCNFSCKMCYVRKTLQEVRAHDRAIITLNHWLDFAREAREQGMLYLLLTGGEPFLWPDFWFLYEELAKMGFLISINTNGSLIDDNAIARMKNFPPARINITMYGASDETYEALCGARNVFSQVDRAICGLQEADIQVKLNCSLTPHNAHDLEAIIQYADNKNLIVQVSTYMFPPLRRDKSLVGCNDRFSPRDAAYYHIKRYKLQSSPEDYLYFLNQTANGLVTPLGLDESCVDPIDGKIRCRAGNASFWITWDGWMTPCGMMPEPKVDVVSHGFSAAWKEIVDISDNMALSGICAQCPDRQMCHSCAAMAVAETGGTEGIPQYLCEMVLAMREIAKEELATREKM